MNDVLIALILTLGLSAVLLGCWLYARTLPVRVLTYTTAQPHGFAVGERVAVDFWDGARRYVTIATITPDSFSGKAANT